MCVRVCVRVCTCVCVRVCVPPSPPSPLPPPSPKPPESNVLGHKPAMISSLMVCSCLFISCFISSLNFSKSALSESKQATEQQQTVTPTANAQPVNALFSLREAHQPTVARINTHTHTHTHTLYALEHSPGNPCFSVPSSWQSLGPRYPTTTTTAAAAAAAAAVVCSLCTIDTRALCGWRRAGLWLWCRGDPGICGGGGGGG